MSRGEESILLFRTQRLNNNHHHPPLCHASYFNFAILLRLSLSHTLLLSPFALLPLTQSTFLLLCLHYFVLEAH